MKFKTDFEMEVLVEFKDPEKAKRFFIDGTWEKYFYTFDNLQELTEHLAYAFYQTPEAWDKGRRESTRYVEGFGMFVHGDTLNEWVNLGAGEEEYGKVVVLLGELEAAHTCAA